jgi:hypothetical protein
MLIFLFLAPVSFWVLLQKPIIEVHLSQTIIQPEHRLNKLIPLLGFCLVACFVVVFVLGFMYVKEVQVNQRVVEKYNEQYQLFLGVCDANLSEFNQKELKRVRCDVLNEFYDLNLYNPSELVSQECQIDLNLGK